MCKLPKGTGFQRAFFNGAQPGFLDLLFAGCIFLKGCAVKSPGRIPPCEISEEQGRSQAIVRLSAIRHLGPPGPSFTRDSGATRIRFERVAPSVEVMRAFPCARVNDQVRQPQGYKPPFPYPLIDIKALSPGDQSPILPTEHPGSLKVNCGDLGPVIREQVKEVFGAGPGPPTKPESLCLIVHEGQPAFLAWVNPPEDHTSLTNRSYLNSQGELGPRL
jgi:hypothetical protein